MRKVWLLSIVIFLIIILSFLTISYDLLKIRPFPVAVISDIHLGTSLCNPKQCKDNIESALKEVLEKTDGMLLLSIGDNTDASEFSEDQKTASALREDYKNKLLEMTAGREVLWVNGNHDRETYLSGQEYYSYDKNNWRFIIIHTTDVEGDQLAWLTEQLKTDKNKIVMMHHPVYKQGSKEIIERYKILIKLFEENNVKYVLSGHWHSDNYERDMGGVIYKAIRGLTYNFQTNYEILPLTYRKIDVLNLSPRIKMIINIFNPLFN